MEYQISFTIRFISGRSIDVVDPSGKSFREIKDFIGFGHGAYRITTNSDDVVINTASIEQLIVNKPVESLILKEGSITIREAPGADCSPAR